MITTSIRAMSAEEHNYHLSRSVAHAAAAGFGVDEAIALPWFAERVHEANAFQLAEAARVFRVVGPDVSRAFCDRVAEKILRLCEALSSPGGQAESLLRACVGRNDGVENSANALYWPAVRGNVKGCGAGAIILLVSCALNGDAHGVALHAASFGGQCDGAFERVGVAVLEAFREVCQ